MKVRMSASIAGFDPDTGAPISFHKGQEVEVSSSWAKSLMEVGDAEPIAQKTSKRAETREKKAPKAANKQRTPAKNKGKS